ncbi:MAG: SGNH/GDSL hydrolase family protein [Pseudomonadota bacterium]
MTLPAALLLPLIVPQGLWVAARALRLPEATGPRSGRAGDGPTLRLLIAGDSSAAGVGVATQDDALAGRLVAKLATKADVDWSLAARSGATSAGTLARLAALPAQPVDALVIAVGVNDVKNGVTARTWMRNVNALLDLAEARFGAPRIYVSGLPPVGDFPLLPDPLRRILGKRARGFDARVARIAADRARVRHIPLRLAMEASDMAPDGFHPGPAIYAGWAGLLAEAILADVPEMSARLG